MKNKSVDRRSFFRMSVTAGAGALLVPEVLSAALPVNEKETENKKIPERTLGRTGVKLPILSMGIDRPDSNNVLRAAYNSGVFHFDTAHIYQKGRNEEMLGNFFNGKPRSTCFISTKVMFDYPLQDNFEQTLLEKLDISLKRLKMDQVDLFYIHSISQAETIKDKRVLDILQKIKADGKTRFVGFSSHDQKPELIDVAVETGIYDVALISYNFKIKNLKETDEAIERAAKAGMGFVAMKTMAGGTEDAEGKKKIDGRACLKWIWRNPHITTVIPGLTNFDHLDECLAAANDTGLTEEEQNYLLALCDRESLYCQQCGLCRSQCPEHLPIPDIMRAYMYAYGYKHAQQSKETLAELNLKPDLCADCDVCQVNCPSGFDVSKKIAAIAPVVGVPDIFLT